MLRRNLLDLVCGQWVKERQIDISKSCHGYVDDEGLVWLVVDDVSLTLHTLRFPNLEGEKKESNDTKAGEVGTKDTEQQGEVEGSGGSYSKQNQMRVPQPAAKDVTGDWTFSSISASQSDGPPETV